MSAPIPEPRLADGLRLAVAVVLRGMRRVVDGRKRAGRAQGTGSMGYHRFQKRRCRRLKARARRRADRLHPWLLPRVGEEGGEAIADRGAELGGAAHPIDAVGPKTEQSRKRRSSSRSYAQILGFQAQKWTTG